MQLVNSFERDMLKLDRLNYAMINLLPKELEAGTLKKYRPISLLNCSFKIFGKLLNNRLIKIANRLIASIQTTFIKGRFYFGKRGGGS
jgi:NADPH-dependent 7-cyano-7-deazaguanine reductase QueF